MSNNQKVAFITGAARRIGAEIARILHEAGWNILLHYHCSEKEAYKLSQELNLKRLDSVYLIKADLSEIKKFKEIMENAIQKWGRLDALINNAAQFYKTPLGSIDEKAWNTLLDINLKGPFFLSQAAEPFLRMSYGTIVNIADFHGKTPLKNYSVYSISKAGLIMLTKSLAKEWAPIIRVNAVAPSGGILWPQEENSLTEKEKQKIIEKTALKREGSADFIAHAVLFFLQNANYITGQVLSVDGGRI